jgi:small subunit ribosomal protein S9
MAKKSGKIKYDYGTGRRKTAAARVFLAPGKGGFTVNNRELAHFFSRLRSQIVATQALQVANLEGKFDLKVTVRGGGESGQAEAVRHGVARALVAHNPDLKPALRAAGLMSRDPRAVERKKAGLRKARRSRQYSKR